MASSSSNDENNLFTMNQIPNVDNVSPNVSPNRNLNYPDPESPFLGLNYGRKLYELDYLLKKNIRLLTGARKRVYKGLHLVCDDERKTCKYKILDSEIEARGDCFFHSALYNLGKKYLGPRESRLEDNIENARKFREFLVDYYIERTGNRSALEFRGQYDNADSQMVQAYAHKFNRNVCVFVIRDEGAFDRGESHYDISVELMINKNALRGKIDFFILTQAPEHYTTLKRIPGFKSTLMNRFLDYVYKVEASNINEWKSEIPIREDIRIQHDRTEAKGRFEDTIRSYMITGVRNVYRLFQTPFPEFPAVEDFPNVEIPGSPSLSPTTLAGLPEDEQLEYVLKKTSRRAKASNVNAPFGTVLGVTRYSNPKIIKPIGPLSPLRPLSDFEPSKEEHAKKMFAEARDMSPYTAAQLKNHFNYSPVTNPEEHAKKMFAEARDMSPYTASQLKNHFGYSPGSKGSLKPRPKVSPKARIPRPAPKPRPRPRTKKSSESISNANIAQLLEVHSPKTVEQITGKKLNGLNEKPKKSSESISNSDIAQLLAVHSPKTVEQITGKKLSGISRRPAPRNPNRFLSPNGTKKIRPPPSKKKVPLKSNVESAAPVFANSPKFARRRSRSPRNLNRAPGSGFFTSMFGLPRIFSKKK